MTFLPINKKINPSHLLMVAALAVIIYAGVEFRFSAGNYYLGRTANVISYYYDKSERLLVGGQFPRQELWRFAPAEPAENAPPFLAYFSVFSYKIAKIFFDNLTFYDFAMILPVAVYVLWCVFGFLAVCDIFGGKIYGMIFAVIFSVIPVSIDLTKWGFYTEEFLGAVLFFFGLYFLMKFGEGRKLLNFYWAAVFFVLFALTWPQYPLPLLGLAAILLIWGILKKINPRTVFYCFTVFISLLIVSHLICVYLIGIAYSPVLFLKEVYLGAINYNLSEIKLAMARNDWQSLDAFKFIREFGLLTWVLIPFGFLLSLLKIRENKHHTIAIFSLLTLLIAFAFTKSRFLALPPLLFLAVSGMDFFYRQQNAGAFSILSGVNLARIFAILKKNKRKIFIIMITIMAAAVICFVCRIMSGRLAPKPEIEFLKLPPDVMSGAIEDEKGRLIVIRLRNVGGSSLKEEQAFGGLHIEVENAEVRNISASSSFTKGSIAMKPDFQRGNIFWFEVKFLQLKNNEFGDVAFNIVPYSQPVSIYYRGWLPGACGRQDRQAVLEELRPEWKNQENAWRSEKCLKRLPANDDFSSSLCLVDVYAAHQDSQKFKCLKKLFITASNNE